MGNNLSSINLEAKSVEPFTITAQLAYLENLTDFKSGRQNIDHSVRGRVWFDKPISSRWSFRGMFELLARLQPLISDKNLKPADYAGAGFPPRPSGVSSVDGVTTKITRQYSIQPAIDLFFLYRPTSTLRFGPRVALSGAFTAVENENIPQEKPTPKTDCKDSGDIYCVSDQPKPSPVQLPSVIQQNLNKAFIARIGGLLSYDPFTWLGFGFETYLQTSVYNGGSTLWVVRPELKFTLPLQQKWKLKAPDLFAQGRIPVTLDLLNENSRTAIGYDLFLGAQIRF